MKYILGRLIFYLGGRGPFSDIEFTMETEANNELTFLRRSHKEGHFRFQHPACIGKKKTFTGTYMNWKSLAPRTYKIGLIDCLFVKTSPSFVAMVVRLGFIELR